MPHDHFLIDDDNRFIINGVTRQVTNLTGNRPSVMQFDHNSELFTFQMPRYVEGHDMMLCDRVEIHLTNTGKGTSVSNRPVLADIDLITDLAISEEDETLLTFSWTITRNATQYAGTLVFQFNFICDGETEEDPPEFEWHTEQYSFIDVIKSLKITDEIAEAYPDLLTKFSTKIDGFNKSLIDFERDIEGFKDDKLDVVEAERTYVNKETYEETVEELGNLRDASETHTSKANAASDKNVAITRNVPETTAPYAKIAEIGGKTRKCTNLLGGEALANKIKSVNANAVIDTTAKTVVYYASAMQSKVLFADFKPNTQYTFILKGKASARHLNMNIKYTDGTAMDAWMFPTKDTEATLCLVSAPGKSISEMVGVYNDGNTTLYYNECGIFEGVLTVEDFEPYFEGLRSAPVTEVESVGVNLIPDKIEVGALGINDGKLVSYISGETCHIKGIPLKAGTYTASGVDKIYFYAYDENGVADLTKSTPQGVDSPHTFTVDTDCYCGVTGSRDSLAKHMLNKGTTALPYRPYVKHTLPIPEAVQALDGYGWGVSDSLYNYVDFEKRQFVKRVGCVDLGTLNWVFTDMHSLVTINDMDLTPEWFSSAVPSKVKQMAYDSTQPIFYLFYDSGAYASLNDLIADLPGIKFVYELAEPVVTDISDLLHDDIISVEAGGTVTLKNPYNYDVPNEVVFYKDSNETIGADTFVGDLAGTAARAVADAYGNPFPKEDATHAGCFYRMVNGAQEWINPPMELNTEYRTTERYMGKPVYTKLISLGTLPNNTSSYILDSIPHEATVISFDGYCSDGGGEAALLTIISKIWHAKGSNYIGITTNSNQSSFTETYLIVKYTK